MSKAQETQAPVPDDEFEDFPHEDWSNEDAALGVKKEWEDSWDDDDVQDDFSKQLKAELEKQETASGGGAMKQ